MKRVAKFLSCVVLLTNCADDQPYLEGHIRRAADAIMTPCDPYNKGAHHTCVVYSSAFKERLLVFDATAREMVLSPMGYFPLSIKVGASTNELAAVKSSNQKFPYFLALDHSLPALFVVRAFSSSDKKQTSFSPPLQHTLERKPYKFAAFDNSDSVIVILSYPQESSIDVLSLDKESGKILASRKNIKIAHKPSHIEVDDELKKAIISNEESNSIYVLDLSTINKVLDKSAEAAISSIDIGMKSDRIYVSSRDFGAGKSSYLVALNAAADEIKLIDLNSKMSAIFELKEHALSVYFPSAESEPFSGTKNWIAVASIKGNLFHIGVENSGGQLSLKELSPTVDLTSNRNMSLNQLHVRKMLGGPVLFDSSLGRKAECDNNREIFFVSSYASERINPLTLQSQEVEAQGRACEGASAASRLGFKRE